MRKCGPTQKKRNRYIVSSDILSTGTKKEIGNRRVKRRFGEQSLGGIKKKTNVIAEKQKLGRKGS